MSVDEYAPIVGDLRIETSDGSVIYAANDARLAWKWTEYELETKGVWDGLSHVEQARRVNEALLSIRQARQQIHGAGHSSKRTS